MDEDNEAQLVVELRVDEGVRYTPYRDTKGFLTVGAGHNLDASPLPDGWTYPLTDDLVNVLLESDLQNVFDDLDNALPWWRGMDDVRQRVICNMCFNLGLTKLLGFRNTLTAMRQGRYADAATGMLASAWASQVGARAARLANMMKNGV
ncbi:glycoside hydrolase family protein [Paraburkholderia sp. BL21I4N1]|uniref:glycoside hydrolase family protein n=1 Tax=Paraburkholderia sp. BL21I4N1 TaxID=1938801 RepID=UPI000CFD91C7|nr:lysozyme [Paraburkholderia sp. BL21I4N1]PQV51874.1 lysozyme [Paraburkholderia sp. BL21I4N1]